MIEALRTTSRPLTEKTAVTGLPTAGYEWYYFRVRAVNAGGASGWSPNNAIALG